MTPLRGWAARGKRLIGKAPFGHWNTMTFIAALRHDAITAPWVIDGPINGSILRTYVENVLVPTLSKGDIVILDNLGSHKVPAIRNAIKAAGGTIVLPPRLLARSQPNRTGIRQAQTSAAQGRRAQQRNRLAQDRLTPRPVQPSGM